MRCDGLRLRAVAAMNRYFRTTKTFGGLSSEAAFCCGVAPEVLTQLILLRYHLTHRYDQFIDIVVTDNLGRPGPRFTVRYLLTSSLLGGRFMLILAVADQESLLTAQQIFPGAGWSEREVWDMFGIPFHGHRDLRRILTDYGFRGFPLRKDFPVAGFSEVFYSDRLGFLRYRPVSLMQELRWFGPLSPWGLFPHYRY